MNMLISVYTQMITDGTLDGVLIKNILLLNCIKRVQKMPKCVTHEFNFNILSDCIGYYENYI